MFGLISPVFLQYGIRQLMGRFVDDDNLRLQTYPLPLSQRFYLRRPMRLYSVVAGRNYRVLSYFFSVPDLPSG